MTNGQHPIARTTVGVVIPAAIDFGTHGVVAVPEDVRDDMECYAQDFAAQVLRIAAIEIDLTIVWPDRFALPMTKDCRVADQNAAAKEFRRVGLSDQYSRVLLVPQSPGVPFSYGGTSWGADNGDRMTLVRDVAGEYRVGAFGVRGPILTHEWLHTVEWGGKPAGIKHGYGLDCPLVHDGGAAGGKHTAQYPDGQVDRWQWKWLRDLMTARVPHPTKKGVTYGYTAAMWQRLFPVTAAQWPPAEAVPPRDTLPDPPPRVPVWTTADLNLRAGPGTDSLVLTVIPAATGIRVTEPAVNSFVATRYGGQHGWVSADYLARSPPEPLPAPAPVTVPPVAARPARPVRSTP